MEVTCAHVQLGINLQQMDTTVMVGRKDFLRDAENIQTIIIDLLLFF